MNRLAKTLGIGAAAVAAALITAGDANAFYSQRCAKGGQIFIEIFFGTMGRPDEYHISTPDNVQMYVELDFYSGSVDNTYVRPDRPKTFKVRRDDLRRIECSIDYRLQ